MCIDWQHDVHSACEKSYFTCYKNGHFWYPGLTKNNSGIVLNVAVVALTFNNSGFSLMAKVWLKIYKKLCW